MNTSKENSRFYSQVYLTVINLVFFTAFSGITSVATGKINNKTIVSLDNIKTSVSIASKNNLYLTILVQWSLHKVMGFRRGKSGG